MTQRQAVLSVRVVLDDGETLDEAEEIVTDALTSVGVRGIVKGERVEQLNDKGEVTKVED